IVQPGPFSSTYRAEIISHVARHRLPAVYPYRYLSKAGGLLSYGNDVNENFRHAALYIDRILKGEKPADLIPKKPGVRVKTNRRDAVELAKLSRAGELTAVWVPDERHEAMRDLSRARQAARKHLVSKRQQISSLMLRLGRHYPGKKTWGP